MSRTPASLASPICGDPMYISNDGNNCEYKVMTAWALAGSSMIRLAREHAGQIIIDTGFDGLAVVGTKQRATLMSLPSVKSVECKGTVYRFGGGTAKAVETLSIEMRIGAIDVCICVDLVPGSLPFLGGRKLQKAAKLVLDLEDGNIFQKHDGKLQMIGSYRDGMPVLPIACSEKVSGLSHRDSIYFMELANDDCLGGAVDDKQPLDVITSRELRNNMKEALRESCVQSDIPKCLRLSDEDIRKLHRRGHPTAEKLFTFLRGTLSRTQQKEYKISIDSLRKRVNCVVQACNNCARMSSVRTPGTAIPTVRDYLDLVVVDLMTLNSDKGWYALVIVDSATSDLALAFVKDSSAAESVRAFHERWSSIRGLSSVIMSDGGTSFCADFMNPLPCGFTTRFD